MLKTCTACKLDLPANVEHFYADNRVKSKLRSKCKVCQLKRNKETQDPITKKRYDQERYMGLRTISREDALRRGRERARKYNATESGVEKKRAWLRRWRAKNPGKRRENERLYKARHPEKIKLKVQRQTARRRATIEGRLNVRMSTRIRNFVKRGKAGASWVDLVGYSALELRVHLERQFTKGMTWQKLLAGRIHIDHIVPLCEFRFGSIDSEGFRSAWALSNLRPLWAKDNLEKSSRRVFLL